MYAAACWVLLLVGSAGGDGPGGGGGGGAAAPAVREEKKLAPQSAVLALKRWHDAALCSTCKGSGKVTKSVPVGTSSGQPNPAGPIIRQPVKRDVVVDCPTCDGERITKEGRAVASANAFAKALAQIDTTDAKWPGAHDDMVEKLRELVGLGMKAWRNRLNRSIGVLLTGTAMKSDQPVVFVGSLDQERQKNETDERVVWVLVESTSVRFEKPRLVDTTWPSEKLRADKKWDHPDPPAMLCGGWLVRREDDSGRFESVVEGGFVVAGR